MAGIETQPALRVGAPVATAVGAVAGGAALIDISGDYVMDLKTRIGRILTNPVYQSATRPDSGVLTAIANPPAIPIQQRDLVIHKEVPNVTQPAFAPAVSQLAPSLPVLKTLCQGIPGASELLAQYEAEQRLTSGEPTSQG